jgi:hypothetical protein
VGSGGVVDDVWGGGSYVGNTVEGGGPAKSAEVVLSGMELAESFGGALENFIGGHDTNKVVFSVAVGGEPSAIDGTHVGRVKGLGNKGGPERAAGRRIVLAGANSRVSTLVGGLVGTGDREATEGVGALTTVVIVYLGLGGGDRGVLNDPDRTGGGGTRDACTTKVRFFALVDNTVAKGRALRVNAASSPAGVTVVGGGWVVLGDAGLSVLPDGARVGCTNERGGGSGA